MKITGNMARRILVNWRVPMEMAQRVLPPSIRPRQVAGYAVAGLCLVRLERERPLGIPAWMGMTSENLAVRMAIEGEGGSGVLVFRRETASRINSMFGELGHFGKHHRAAFQVDETSHHARITVGGKDHTHHASVTDGALNPGSVFQDLNAADAYFRGGSTGYSPGRSPGVWEGLRLHPHRWEMHPMRLLAARSSLIDSLFDGTAVVDSAFIMRNIEHTWFPVPPLHCSQLRKADLPHAACAA